MGVKTIEIACDECSKYLNDGDRIICSTCEEKLKDERDEALGDRNAAWGNLDAARARIAELEARISELEQTVAGLESKPTVFEAAPTTAEWLALLDRLKTWISGYGA